MESKKLKGIVRTSSFSNMLTPDQDKILEERIKKYETGLMKFSSWEDVKSRIKLRSIKPKSI